MKKLFVSLFAVSIVALASPANADSILQIWECSINEGHTDEEMMKLSKDWLDAAKGMEGGADFDVTIEFPVVTGDNANTFNFVLSAPDLKTWGLFNNGYLGSAVSAVDEKFVEVAACDGSVLLNSIAIE